MEFLRVDNPELASERTLLKAREIVSGVGGRGGGLPCTGLGLIRVNDGKVTRGRRDDLNNCRRDGLKEEEEEEEEEEEVANLDPD